MMIVPLDEHDDGYGAEVAFSPDGRLWVAAERRLAHLWEGRHLRETIDLNGQGTGRARFSANGRWLLLGAQVYDLTAGRLLDLPPLASSLIAGLDRQTNPRADLFELTGAAWSPDGARLVVATRYRPPRGVDARWPYSGPRQRLLLLDGQSRALVASLWEGTSATDYAVIAVEPRFIAAGGLPILVWDGQTQRPVAELAEPTIAIRDLAFSADGAWLASAGWDGRVIVWETRQWQPVADWPAHEGYARVVAFHPRQPLLATGGGEAALKLWSVASHPELIATLPVAGNVEGLAFHPDGEQVVVAIDTGTLLTARLQAS